MWMLKINWVDNPNEQMERMYLVQECHNLVHGEINKEVKTMQAEYILYKSMDDALTFLKSNMEKASNYKVPVDFIKAKKKYYETCEKDPKKSEKLREKLHPMITKYKENCQDGFLGSLIGEKGDKDKEMKQMMAGFDQLYCMGKEEETTAVKKRNERLNELMMEIVEKYKQ